VATQELNNGMAGNTLESFAYDKLHRLTQSSRTGAASATITYGYDAAGNFNFKSDFSQATGTPYKLSTGGLGGGGANAVKSVTLINGSTRSYGYDASGNMTADNAGFSAKYDHANLATKLQRGAVINTFIYGPNNAKARQTGTDGSKVYLGGYEDWITANQTKVSLGNYAQVTNGTGGRVLNYFLTDRLGSVDAVTDGNGNLVETRGYDAFGAPRTGVWGDAAQIASTAITPKGFTGHEHLNSVQLIHMNGRMYDYQLGRFLGVDPFIQAPTNSQSLNPYSYLGNNPLSGTDPTGYTTECVDAGCPEIEQEISGDELESIEIHKDGTVVVNTTNGDSIKASSITIANGSEVQTLSTVANEPPTLTTVALASNRGLPKQFSGYSDNKKSKILEISKGFNTSVNNTKQRSKDQDLTEEQRASAVRQLKSLADGNMTAAIFDNFSQFPGSQSDDAMSVRNNSSILQNGPDSSPQLTLLINLEQVINEYGRTVTSNVAEGYGGVSYGLGLTGIIKKFMHEMRHMDPRNIVQKNSDPNGQNRWIYRPTKERDADKWANEEWSALDDLSDAAFQP
jgi:RHS repeat-associated protein